MTDFVQMMKDWGKMCNSNYECQKCRLSHNPVCGSLSHATDEDISKAEADIMAWAAENQEPQYPTWYEYLVKERILVPRENYTRYDLWNLLISQLQGTPISAEIAEKLGIEPKEDN